MPVLFLLCVCVCLFLKNNFMHIKRREWCLSRKNRQHISGLFKWLTFLRGDGIRGSLNVWERKREKWQTIIAMHVGSAICLLAMQKFTYLRIKNYAHTSQSTPQIQISRHWDFAHFLIPLLVSAFLIGGSHLGAETLQGGATKRSGKSVFPFFLSFADWAAISGRNLWKIGARNWKKPWIRNALCSVNQTCV